MTARWKELYRLFLRVEDNDWEKSYATVYGEFLIKGWVTIEYSPNPTSNFYNFRLNGEKPQERWLDWNC